MSTQNIENSTKSRVETSVESTAENTADYFFAVRNLDSPSDPNIKFYTNAIDAYAELDRRERYGIFADIQDRNGFDYEVSRELVSLRPQQ